MKYLDFNVTITRKERIKRRVIYSIAYAVLLFSFVYGYLTVYINCHNIMSAEPVKLFEWERTDERFSVTILDREFIFR